MLWPSIFANLQPLAKAVGRERAGNQIALTFVAANAFQEVVWLLRLDSFGDHGVTEFPSHGDHVSNQGGATCVRYQVTHKLWSILMMSAGISPPRG